MASAANRAYLGCAGGHHIHTEKLRHTNAEAARLPAAARRRVRLTRRQNQSRAAPGLPPPRRPHRAHIQLCWLALLLIRAAETHTARRLSWPRSTYPNPPNSSTAHPASTSPPPTNVNRAGLGLRYVVPTGLIGTTVAVVVGHGALMRSPGRPLLSMSTTRGPRRPPHVSQTRNCLQRNSSAL